MNPANKYLTTYEASHLLGFSQDHVRRLILTGKIKAIKMGKMWLIEPKNIKHIRRLRAQSKD